MARITANGEVENLMDPPIEYSSDYKEPKRKDITMKMNPYLIDKNNPPSHLKQSDTGRIYVYTPILASRADMEPYEMPKPEAPKPIEEAPVIVEGTPVIPEADPAGELETGLLEPDSSPEADLPADDRKSIIKGAASMVDKEHWIKGTSAWPTSPSSVDIEAIVGFKVSRREIIDAIKE